MAGLSERLRGEASRIWDRIMEHPFVVGLYEGTLELERFKFYIVQDYNFLIESMRAFSLLASKADPETARLALEVAHGDATIELDNYKRLLPRLGLTMEDVLRAEPAPTNLAYTSFLVATCATRGPLECLTALLPCYWSYLEIAEHHKDKLEGNRVQLYRDWASAYLTREYRELVEEMKSHADRLWEEAGGNYEELRRIFITASRYEYLFWDMAYKQERWPI